MSQHAGLSVERWGAFPIHQRILMIGNEMNRGRRLVRPEDALAVKRTYERVLALVDLTVRSDSSPGLRRELLRWRDLVAARYLAGPLDLAAHDAAFRALLRLHPLAARQIPILFG